MADNRNKFEYELTYTFQERLGDEGEAIRRRQHQNTQQRFDVVVFRKVLSNQGEVTVCICIEAKSKSVNSGTKKMYFSKNFNGREQLEKFKEFCDTTGMIPFIGVEARQHGGSKAYLIELGRVMEWFDNGKKGIPLKEDELTSFDRVHKLDRVSTKRQEEEDLPKYVLPENFLGETLNYR